MDHEKNLLNIKINGLINEKMYLHNLTSKTKYYMKS